MHTHSLPATNKPLNGRMESSSTQRKNTNRMSGISQQQCPLITLLDEKVLRTVQRDATNAPPLVLPQFYRFEQAAEYTEIWILKIKVLYSCQCPLAVGSYPPEEDVSAPETAAYYRLTIE